MPPHNKAIGGDEDGNRKKKNTTKLKHSQKEGNIIYVERACGHGRETGRNRDRRDKQKERDRNEDMVWWGCIRLVDIQPACL